jgi:hypothetical protein
VRFLLDGFWGCRGCWSLKPDCHVARHSHVQGIFGDVKFHEFGFFLLFGPSSIDVLGVSSHTTARLCGAFHPNKNLESFSPRVTTLPQIYGARGSAEPRRSALDAVCRMMATPKLQTRRWCQSRSRLHVVHELVGPDRLSQSAHPPQHPVVRVRCHGSLCIRRTAEALLDRYYRFSPLPDPRDPEFFKLRQWMVRGGTTPQFEGRN